MFDKNLPLRSKNHILETASYKIFSDNIPNRWLVRDISERDYGIDVLVEIVTDNNQVTGEILSVQLKSKEFVEFNKNGKFRFYNVNRTTTNYWLNSNVPTFLALIDITSGIVYIKSVNEYVRENYHRYKSEVNGFYYEFCEDEKMSSEEFLVKFNQAKNFSKVEEKISSFDSLHEVFLNFYFKQIRRDFHQLVDDDEVLREFAYILNSIKYMSEMLNVTWTLPTPEEFVACNDIGIDAAYDPYFMYEYHMTEYLKMLDVQFLKLTKLIKSIVGHKHKAYWDVKQPFLNDYLKKFGNETFEERYWRMK